MLSFSPFWLCMPHICVHLDFCVYEKGNVERQQNEETVHSTVCQSVFSRVCRGGDLGLTPQTDILSTEIVAQDLVPAGMKQCSKERPSCWSRLKTISKQAQAAQQIFQTKNLDSEICKLVCFALYVILTYLMWIIWISDVFWPFEDQTRNTWLWYYLHPICTQSKELYKWAEQKTVFMPLQNAFQPV